MKKLTIIKLSISICIGFLLGGCSITADETQATWNEMKAEKKSPVRLIKDESFTNKNSTRLIEGWAGIPGASAVNDTYKKMAFDAIQKNCGYGKTEFFEFRIVKHAVSSWEEVWLFNDPASHRDDKVSGITVFFQYNSKTNITQVQLFGACHTGKGTSLTIS